MFDDNWYYRIGAILVFILLAYLLRRRSHKDITINQELQRVLNSEEHKVKGQYD